MSALTDAARVYVDRELPRDVAPRLVRVARGCDGTSVAIVETSAGEGYGVTWGADGESSSRRFQSLACAMSRYAETHTVTAWEAAR